MRKVISQQKADKTFKRQKKFNTSLTFKEDKPKNKKDEMIKDINEGFMVTELIGSSVSLITGDYSRGASGFWIKNGKISHPTSEATIAGNLKDMFMQLTPASDLDLSYPIASPSLRVDNMVVAGK